MSQFWDKDLKKTPVKEAKLILIIFIISSLQKVVLLQNTGSGKTPNNVANAESGSKNVDEPMLLKEPKPLFTEPKDPEISVPEVPEPKVDLKDPDVNLKDPEVNVKEPVRQEFDRLPMKLQPDSLRETDVKIRDRPKGNKKNKKVKDSSLGSQNQNQQVPAVGQQNEIQQNPPVEQQNQTPQNPPVDQQIQNQQNPPVNQQNQNQSSPPVGQQNQNQNSPPIGQQNQNQNSPPVAQQDQNQNNPPAGQQNPPVGEQIQNQQVPSVENVKGIANANVDGNQSQAIANANNEIKKNDLPNNVPPLINNEPGSQNVNNQASVKTENVGGPIVNPQVNNVQSGSNTNLPGGDNSAPPMNDLNMEPPINKIKKPKNKLVKSEAQSPADSAAIATIGAKPPEAIVEANKVPPQEAEFQTPFIDDNREADIPQLPCNFKKPFAILIMYHAIAKARKNDTQSLPDIPEKNLQQGLVRGLGNIANSTSITHQCEGDTEIITTKLGTSFFEAQYMFESKVMDYPMYGLVMMSSSPVEFSFSAKINKKMKPAVRVELRLVTPPDNFEFGVSGMGMDDPVVNLLGHKLFSITIETIHKVYDEVFQDILEREVTGTHTLYRSYI